MNLDLSALGASEQATLAALLAKLTPAAPGSPADPPEPKPAKRRRADTIKYFTEPQINAFFRVIENPRDIAIFRIAYHRGLRASEIGMIQLADYLERDDRLVIRRLKGSAGGEYHLCAKEVRALKAWLKVRGREPGAIFLSRVGRPITQQALDLLVKKYGRLAELPRELCHCHAFKHSCATHLISRGESLDDVRDHLGHRNPQNTLIYAQFTNKRRLERDKRLRDW
jgi:integrase